MDRGNKKPASTTVIPRCTFVGGNKGGAFTFTGKQLRFPCKLRRHICARCGMHRGEHHQAHAGIRDEHLPPRKRSVFRRLVQFQFQVQKDKRAALGAGEIWNGDAITKGKRAPRIKARERAVGWPGKFE